MIDDNQQPVGALNMHDLLRCRSHVMTLMRTPKTCCNAPKAIKLAIFDVDGVLTDGRLYFLVDGSEFKTFNTLDSHGIKC